MAFDYTKAVVSLPKNNTDKIIGVLTGTINVSGATSPSLSAAASDIRDTKFNDWCLFSGIYSIDGGNTWNDMGAQTPDLSVPGSPVFDTLDCAVSCSLTGVFTIEVTNYVNPNTGSTPARTVLYKVLLLAKKGQKIIDPLPTNALPLYHSSRYNYQKISLEGQGSFTAPAGSTGQLVVNHNLGYIPNIRAWEITSTLVRPVVFQPEIQINTTGVVFFYDAYYDFSDKTFQIVYRIYLDG